MAVTKEQANVWRKLLDNVERMYEVKVGFVSLGCSKNLVDTEMMIGLFKNNQFEVVADPQDAEIILVTNTIGKPMHFEQTEFNNDGRHRLMVDSILHYEDGNNSSVHNAVYCDFVEALGSIEVSKSNWSSSYKETLADALLESGYMSKAVEEYGIKDLTDLVCNLEKNMVILDYIRQGHTATDKEVAGLVEEVVTIDEFMKGYITDTVERNRLAHSIYADIADSQYLVDEMNDFFNEVNPYLFRAGYEPIKMENIDKGAETRNLTFGDKEMKDLVKKECGYGWKQLPYIDKLVPISAIAEFIGARNKQDIDDWLYGDGDKEKNVPSMSDNACAKLVRFMEKYFPEEKVNLTEEINKAYVEELAKYAEKIAQQKADVEKPVLNEELEAFKNGDYDKLLKDDNEERDDI